MNPQSNTSSQIANPTPGVVTVWSDIACPWAGLALAILADRASEREVPYVVDHRAFPLELFNRRATPKLILDAEVVAIGALLPSLQWQLWGRPEGSYPVTSLPALAAVQAAKSDSVGGLGASMQLDSALRAAFYTDQLCISMISVIEDVARQCTEVDAGALMDRLSHGAGHAEVFKQWKVAQSDAIQGSPQLFTASGASVHNPGVDYHWTAPAPQGLPRFESYDPSWADTLLDAIEDSGSPDSTC